MKLAVGLASAAALLVQPDITFAGRCDRDRIKIEKEIPPNTVERAEFQSLVGKWNREGAQDNVFMYCVQNTEAQDTVIRFQWFKSVPGHTYFDAFIGPGEEEGKTETSLVPHHSAKRRVLYNYAVESSANTLFIANEHEDLAEAQSSERKIETAADFLIPMSDQVIEQINKGEYKYRPEDFVKLAIEISSEVKIDANKSRKLANVLQILPEKGQFLENELLALKNYPLVLTGNLDAFGVAEGFAFYDTVESPIEQPIDDANLRPVSQRIGIQNKNGVELASMSFFVLKPE